MRPDARVRPGRLAAAALRQDFHATSRPRNGPGTNELPGGTQRRWLVRSRQVLRSLIASPKTDIAYRRRIAGVAHCDTKWASAAHATPTNTTPNGAENPLAPEMRTPITKISKEPSVPARKCRAAMSMRVSLVCRATPELSGALAPVPARERLRSDASALSNQDDFPCADRQRSASSEHSRSFPERGSHGRDYSRGAGSGKARGVAVRTRGLAAVGRMAPAVAGGALV